MLNPSDLQPDLNPAPMTRLKQNYCLLAPIVLGLVVGVGVTYLAKILLDYVLGVSISWPFYVVPGILVTVALIAREWTAKELNFTLDWQVLSAVAYSKALMLISVALTVVPLALSASQAVNKQDLLPFDLYLYWVSGLSFFGFILVYRIVAPTVFKYSSYRDLIDREGSVRVLRDSFAELQRLEGARKAPFSVEREALVPVSDVAAIRTLDIQHVQHQEQIYFLMREYARRLKPKCRAALEVLLLAPVFFVMTITLSKMYAVGVQASQTAQCYDGWIKATYWNMLKAAPSLITQDKLRSTQECLHILAVREEKAAS
ncbi:hypothetical protein [Pseudomonas viridiflava]|uniref:hypothetical protein n=1 Tax=Pseudomonas viridiflava TaxID=33069 RepID=UPI000F070A53|nr:hypothetical protein [Pseudomonas viridiflava]